jgi:hypothetical protein
MNVRKFRKRPVVIEAMEWGGGRENAWVIIEWLKGYAVDADWRWDSGTGERLTISTLEGAMEATPGDFIIKGVKGEFYPCKPDIFAATYEAVDE